MHDVFEVAFRDEISVDAVIEFLSQYFSIERSRILSEDDYWMDEWDGKERVGISVHAASTGLKTNVSGTSFRSLDDLGLATMAAEGAKKLNCETVIGDYRKHGDDACGSFLSYFPDGSVWESVDTSCGSISDVKVVRKVSI